MQTQPVEPVIPDSETSVSPLPETPVVEMPQMSLPAPVVEARPQPQPQPEPQRRTPPPVNLPDDMPIQFRQALEQLGDRVPKEVLDSP